MKYEAVIGLEIHAQLLTASKIFCGCSTAFGAPPNGHVCPVCLGFPGALPVLNKTVVELAAMTGLALNCRINAVSRLARKNYFYPDLPKGYQISQFLDPIVGKGEVELDMPDGSTRKIGITRLHLEQDAGKSMHEHSPEFSFIDLNRAGIALMEIVSEPDIRTPEEAALYLRKLRAIVRYLGTCDGDMDKGSMRCDANVSVRRVGVQEFGTRCEIKNVNSVKFVQKAIEFEAERQVALLEAGGTVVQQTRLYDSVKNETRAMRSKEEAHDYRYFPEPDLPPVHVAPETVEALRQRLAANRKLYGEVETTVFGPTSGPAAPTTRPSTSTAGPSRWPTLRSSGPCRCRRRRA